MFLNNLEDFALAMRIYSIAGQAVTPGKTCHARLIRLVGWRQSTELQVIKVLFNLYDIFPTILRVFLKGIYAVRVLFDTRMSHRSFRHLRRFYRFYRFYPN